MATPKPLNLHLLSEEYLSTSLLQRMASKTDRSCIDTDCWLWTGGLSKAGYGRISIRFPDGERILQAHNVAWSLIHGEIPEGLVLDHTCHGWAAAHELCAGGDTCKHRRCVNPAHLEPKTERENILAGLSPSAVRARKERCGCGRDYTLAANGSRYCRPCDADYQRTPEYRAKKRVRQSTPEFRAREAARKRTPEYRAREAARRREHRAIGRWVLGWD